MDLVPSVPVYVFVFFSLYFQVFLFVTFLEKKKSFAAEARAEMPCVFPSVAIIVPCYNEEHTAARTIESLLALDYPKDKLGIIVVDDGSADGTWRALQSFKEHPQIRLFHKENGGKHTALNFAIAKTDADLVGCLDADSFVEPDTLMKIVKHFEEPGVMAVTPAIKLENPESVLELIQNVEYNFGILFRKLMGALDAIQVTPGPFSIFRKKVFQDLGPYKSAHSTEDLEIAFRMHEAHYRIVNSHKAYVRTVPPKTLKGLYRQRLRWVYGFLRNAIDYRHLFFRRKYGNFGMFTMPAALISIFSVLYLTVFSAMNASAYVADKVTELKTVGVPAFAFRFDWFYVDTGFMAFMAAILFLMVVAMIFLGKLMAEDLKRPPFDVVYFMLLYGFIVPVWLSVAVYKAALSKKISWR